MIEIKLPSNTASKFLLLHKIFKFPLIAVNIFLHLVQIPDPNRHIWHGHQTIGRVLLHANFLLQSRVGKKLVGAQWKWFFREPTQVTIFQLLAFYVQNEIQRAKLLLQNCVVFCGDFPTGVAQMEKRINARSGYEFLGHWFVRRQFEVLQWYILIWKCVDTARNS